MGAILTTFIGGAIGGLIYALVIVIDENRKNK